MYNNNKAGIYLRISHDNGKNKESDSISNQRLMLQSFLSEREDLEFVSEYVDDGYTGFDYDRPGFQQMMQDAKDGKINCIIVKDLSRLGRNFQKTEEYIQRIFPELDIRFISVANCYDSSREQTASERLANPIINLMNEYHVMETSQKIRNVLEHHRKSGKFIGSQAPYGYVIENRALVVDEEAAEVVRKIFSLKIEGYSNQTIAELLNQNDVKSPLEHKLEKGIGGASSEHLKTGEQAAWSSVSVRRILENPVYIGTLVQGKTTSVSYRDKRRFKKDASEMDISENAHESIVPDTSFLIVQDLLGKDTYSISQKVSYLFSGFLFCGNCGNPLYHRKDNENRPVYWLCKNKSCKCRQSIREDALIPAVQNSLKAHVKLVLNHAEPVAMPDFLHYLDSEDERVKKLKEQIQHLETSKSCLQQQTKSGIISETDFAEMNCYYDGRIAKAKYEMSEIQKRASKIFSSADEILSQYRSCYHMSGLTRKDIVTFIERIDVYSKTEIQICFRYQNIFGLGGESDGT